MSEFFDDENKKMMSPWFAANMGIKIKDPFSVVTMDSMAGLIPYKRPLVIYHGNCADGFSAAWCFHHSQEEAQISYDFHAGVYGEELPDVEDRIVYMVDFSYKADKVAQILELCQGLYFIDHHKTAIEDLKQFADHPKFIAYTDLERSGAMLAWDFLYNTTWEYHQQGYKPKILHNLRKDDAPYRQPPMLLEHVQDRDLWKFKLEGTRPIQAGMFSYEYTFENWDKMMLGGLEAKMELWKEGAAIERKHFKDIRELIAVGVRWMLIGEVYMPVLNCPYMWGSDAGHIMSNELVDPQATAQTMSVYSSKEDWAKHNAVGVAAYYYDTADQRIFGMRSADWSTIDVSELATLYGGGGHKHAAGFKVKRSHHLAMD